MINKIKYLFSKLFKKSKLIFVTNIREIVKVRRSYKILPEKDIRIYVDKHNNYYIYNEYKDEYYLIQQCDDSVFGTVAIHVIKNDRIFCMYNVELKTWYYYNLNKDVIRVVGPKVDDTYFYDNKNRLTFYQKYYEKESKRVINFSNGFRIEYLISYIDNEPIYSETMYSDKDYKYRTTYRNMKTGEIIPIEKIHNEYARD